MLSSSTILNELKKGAAFQLQTLYDQRTSLNPF